MTSNVESNLQKLADIKKNNPSATHVYIRRCNKDNLVVDIPIDHAEFTIRNQPTWELVASNKQMDDEVEALFKDDIVELEDLPVFTGNAIPPQDIENGDILPVEDVIVPPKPSEIKRRGRPKKNE